MRLKENIISSESESETIKDRMNKNRIMSSPRAHSIRNMNLNAIFAFVIHTRNRLYKTLDWTRGNSNQSLVLRRSIGQFRRAHIEHNLCSKRMQHIMTVETRSTSFFASRSCPTVPLVRLSLVTHKCQQHVCGFACLSTSAVGRRRCCNQWNRYICSFKSCAHLIDPFVHMRDFGLNLDISHS